MNAAATKSQRVYVRHRAEYYRRKREGVVTDSAGSGEEEFVEARANGFFPNYPSVALAEEESSIVETVSVGVGTSDYPMEGVEVEPGADVDETVADAPVYSLVCNRCFYLSFYLLICKGIFRMTTMTNGTMLKMERLNADWSCQ